MKAICKRIPKTMMFLGPPGSGKDTQANLISDLCGFEVIGTGDMFRSEYDKKTSEGIEAYGYWGKGIWVPDELVYRLLKNWMKNYDASKSWIFSQTVRTVPQVQLFDDLMSEYGRVLDKVVVFTLSYDSAIERMSLRRHCPKCKREYHLKYKKPKKEGICDDDGSKLIIRSDDYPESIKQRMKEFKNKTEPLLEIYRDRGILLEVDGNPSIEDIHKVLVERLSDED